MSPGSRVISRKTGYNGLPGEIIAVEPNGHFRVRLDEGCTMSAHRSDLEEIEETPCREASDEEGGSLL